MITAKVDTKSIENSCLEAAKYSERSLPQIINTSAYWVAVNTKNAMPYVTPEKIDTQLALITHPVIGKRGKPLKNKKRYTAGISTIQNNKEVPLAALIVAARANPNSRYNQLTNQRYKLPKNPFKGVARSVGRALMAQLVDKMAKNRRRSGKFLLVGWIPAVRKLYAFSVQKFMKGSNASEGRKEYYGADLGDAKPAIPGVTCSAEIENDVGAEGPNAANFNRALITYGLPLLQMEIDTEGERNMQYALKHAGGELENTWNKN